MRVELINEKLELVLNALITMDSKFNHNFIDNPDNNKKGVFPRDFGLKEFDWPQGVALLGISSINNYKLINKNEFIKNWYEDRKNEGLPLLNVNTTAPYYVLSDFEEYNEEVIMWAERLINELPRTKENGFQHVTTGETKYKLKLHEEQLWVDTIFMTCLLLAKLGVTQNRNNFIQESLYQLKLHIKYLMEPENFLMYHGWSFVTNSRFNNVFWCRGNSWFTLGFPILMSHLEKVIQEKEKKELISIFQKHCSSLLNYYDKEEGLWHTIIDDNTSYIETSGSANMLTGLILGLKYGYLENDIYETIIEKGVDRIINYIDEDGIVHGVSAGTPVGQSKEDYRNILQLPMVYGQSFVLLLLSHYLKKGDLL